MRGLIVAGILASGCRADAELPCPWACDAPGPTIAWTSYHGAARLGWNDAETTLRPRAIAEQGLVIRWSSPELDAEDIDGIRYPAHVYAAPLWIDDFAIETGPRAGARASVILTATSNGWVYAVAAGAHRCDACSISAGEILWSTRLVDPVALDRLDGGMPMGVLSTPVLDVEGRRLYVIAMDRERGHLAFALDPHAGSVVDGWPVVVDDAALAPVNRNGPAKMQRAAAVSQRGALQLSPAGDRLYVPFATYQGEGVGWLVAIDTETTAIEAAFSSAPWREAKSNGGIWGSGGPAIDADGSVWATTGNSPPGSADTPGVWGNSLLHFDRDLRLLGSYTPFNYCRLDDSNMDLAASPPVLLPALDGSSTPLTVAFGGKQGNAYLVDRSALAGGVPARPPCSTDAAADRSRLPPGVQPQFGTRGPLNVFGPYSEEFGQLDQAKMRSRLAYARLAGASYLFVSGASKAAEDSNTSVPPSLARLSVVTPAGQGAYLEVAAHNESIAFVNPGSPVVSSASGNDAVVWVLDENAPRVASLLAPTTPGPVLYAFDASTLELLWRSDDGALARGGKYSTAVVAHGVAVVATDRIVAFGLPAAR